MEPATLINENYLLIKKMLQDPYCPPLLNSKSKYKIDSRETQALAVAENKRRLNNDRNWFRLCFKFEAILWRLDKVRLEKSTSGKRIDKKFEGENFILKIVESEFDTDNRQLFKDFIYAAVSRLRELALIYEERRCLPINFEKVYWAIDYTLRNKVYPFGSSSLISMTTSRQNRKPLVSTARKIWSTILESFPLFFIMLGVLLDSSSKHKLDEAFKKTINELFKIRSLGYSPPELLHLWGNHEFYNYLRAELALTELNTCNELLSKGKKEPPAASPSVTNYFTFDVAANLRLICLDCYEFSVLGYEPQDPIFIQATEYLNENNKNENKNTPDGLEGDLQRFVDYNGGLSSTQINWLTAKLSECKEQGIKAIICAHVGVVDLDYEELLLWNYKELLELFKGFKGTLIAYLSGHKHIGGYYFDKETSIHHITLPGLVETGPEKNSFATVEVQADRILFKYSSA